MNKLQNYSTRLKWLIPVCAITLMTACGGKDDVLGSSANAALAPSVTTVTPAANANDVLVYDPMISATFNEAVAVVGGGASLVVTCASPCTNPMGTVSVDSANRVATFTPDADLMGMTQYTVTVTGATSLATGLAMKSPYNWNFTTGAASTAVTVTAVAPAANSAGVSINNTIISADFNEAIAPVTGVNFTLTCAAPCVSPTGSVTRDPTNRVATFTLTPGTQLEPMRLYTARVSDVSSLVTGALLTSPFVWTFTTGSTADTTRPRVTFTVPATTSPGPTTGVPTNMAINAVFSENMAPASISSASFSLTCVAPCVNPVGSLSYAVGTKTMVFTPTAALMANTTYTAQITSASTDIAGNALAGNQAALPAASNYVWMFTTSAEATGAGKVSVTNTNPADNAGNVCPDAAINATFMVPSGVRMNPIDVNSSTFTVTEATVAKTPVVASAVVLDAATGRIASFNPLNDLVAGVTYTATLKGGANGVKDLAVPANTMTSDYSWDFTAVDCSVTPSVLIPLGTAATFGTFGGSAGTTNQGILTIINGDIGTTAVSTAVTGFHDNGVGCIYTETPLNIGTVNGKIYTSAPSPTVACPTEGTAVTAAIAEEARADALIAYNALVAQPGGPDQGAGNLANLVLVPGVYTAAAGSFMVEGGDLTLDAQGDTNATWVFQMASTLRVGGPGAAAPQSILLVNGAQAKNVFWQVGTAATINAAGGGTMVGTIISQAGAEISTDGNVAVVTINGRVISLNAAVTMVNTVINVPNP
ncbi:MAG: Ig-like domain-containing protein [Cellvibrio sp.]|uniref:Ig-like domain-containing protein n=1 Tax=Cellvibrio sp. TaxID=1965322 RepID=UPI0027256BEA|nr:Ig-like domain-containing protein [Cellvibrio sp.]